MSLFGRRATARAAKAAEAGGDLVEAARIWGLLGDRGKVGACWARLAERAVSDEERIAALRTAVEHLDGPTDAKARAQAEVRLGEILLARARIVGLAGARERELLSEAAGMLEAHGETVSAGKAWELLGRVEEAARAYEKGGHVDDLERVLSDDLQKASESREVGRRFDEYRLALASGARDRALDALRACATIGPAQGGYAEMLRDLEARFPPAGRVHVTFDGAPREIVGRAEGVVFGRGEADVPLRNLDVSRRHAEVRREGDAWVLRDLGSRSGTMLDRLPIGAPMRLPERGRFGVGPSVVVAFEARAGVLDLEIVEGLDRGRRIVALAAPLEVAGTGRAIGFRGARAVLSGKGEVRLNGGRTADEIVLLVGDVIEVAAKRIEVTG